MNLFLALFFMLKTMRPEAEEYRKSSDLKPVKMEVFEDHI